MEGDRKEVKPSASDAIEQSEESSADVQSYEQLGFSDSPDDPGALFVVRDFAMSTGQALEDCNSPSLVPLLHLPHSSSSSLSLVPLSSGLTQKRGPGRPRKDGTSGPIPRKKMNISSFPGRPRMRTRKGTHKAILPPGSAKLGLSALGSENPNFMRAATSLLASSPNKIRTNLGMHPRLPKPIQFSAGTISLLSSNVTSPMELDDTKEIKSLVKISDISRASPGHSQSLDDYSQETTSKKVCAFCNLGENSLLGQGDLVKFEPSADFSPFKKGLKLRRNSSESESFTSSMLSEPGCSKFSPARRGKGPLRPRSELVKTIRRSISLETQSIMGPADELELVGFLEEPEAALLFEASGHVYAHHCCAAWSEGVCQTEEYYLVNVDKAACNGMSQKCSRCRRYGSTIRCRAPKCTRVYHYPCATSSGTFQDIKTLTLLCPFHLLQAPELAGVEANCQVCDLPGVVSELLFCTSCGQHYHGLCLDPPVGVNPVVRAGWQCPECKICQTCRQPGDDNRMLVCDTCDKGFHTFCLKPVMATIPKNGWKCKSCRVCGDCNSRTPGSGPSSRWHLNYTVCDSCYQQRNKGIACPICGKAYRQFCQRADMVHCTLCRKYIHMDCDARLEKMKDQAALNSYVCPVCVNMQAQGIVPRCLPLSLPEPFKIKEERETGPSFLFESALGSPDFGSISEDAIPENPFSKASSFIQGLPEPMNLSLEDASPPPESAPMLSPLYRPLVGGKFPGKKRMGFGRLRGSGKFAGRRRAKTAELRRKRGPKPKVRTFSLPGTPYFPIDPTSQELIGLHSNASDSRDSKQDDEPTVDNKIILCSATDEFVLSQDLCVMCGSFGQGEEGKLIACSQCGQCYHPYCVNIKITKVILKKGWRCLDCTVCEGCGKPHDEGRLLLCDDCDISYHTYCLDPPLEVVPEGNWKCKWCVKCVDCLSTTPGLNCVWQNNYTLCGPCGSKNSCPACHQIYQDQDLIIQCIHCDRWLHGVCDQMLTEDDAEKAAEFGYHCLLCRPPDEPPPHLIVEEPPAPPVSDEASRALDTAPDDQCHQMDDSETSQFGFSEGGPGDTPKTKPQAQFMLDGVLLSESGMSQIKALTIEQPKKPRVRRTKLQRSLTTLGLSHHQPSGSDVSQPPLILPPAFIVAESRMIDNADLGSLSDPARVSSKLDIDFDLKSETDNTEKKKRQRKLQKLGIGGFQVKPRGRGLSKDSLDSNEIGEIHNMEVQTADIPETPTLEKPKRRRKPAKKKSHLEDSYPNYIQEAFFGKDLLSTSKDISKADLPLDDETNSSSVHESVQEKIPIIYSDIPSSTGPSAPPAANHPQGSVLTPPPSLNLTPPGPQLIHQGGRPSIGHPQVRMHQHPPQQTPLIIPPPIRQSLPQPMVVPAAAPPPPPPPAPPSVSFAGKLIGAHQEMMSQREDSLDKSTGDADDSNSKDEDLASSESLKDLLPLPQDDELMDMLIGDDELTKPDDADLGLPQMDSKDVEDIFKDVLSPDNLNEQSSLGSTGMPRGPQQSPAHGSQPSRPPSLPPQTSIHLPGPSTPSSVPSIGSPFSIPPPSPYPSEYSSGTSQFSPQVSEQQLSPWPESESEPQTHSQKNSQKWEIDEALGPMATISPVLYANLIHANLKLEYPLWTDRAKHIAKIWRHLSSDKRQPYLQKARENRTASRMSKTHGVATHGLSPHVPPVGAPQPSPTTPTQPESGKSMNQRSAREIEQERQWKHMQVLRQQQQQQQNQILAEQKQQSFIKVQQSVTMEQHEVSVESGFMQVPPSPAMRSGPSPSPSPSTPSSSAYQSDMSSLCQMTATAGMDIANQGPPSIQSPASSPFHASQRSPSSVRSPTSVSPLIQVSRVRPPIDPSRLPPNEQHLGSPGTPRPVENLFLPPYRMPGGPRPGMMHPQQQQQQMLLRPDAPRCQTPSPSTPDFYQTPPSTPCPAQPMDQFRQATSPAHGLLHGQDPFLQLSPNPMQQNAGNSPYSDSQMNQGQVASPLDPYARAPSTPCPPPLPPPPQIPTSSSSEFVTSPSGMNVPVQIQNRMMDQQMQQHPPRSPVSQMQLPPPPSSPMPVGSPGEGFGGQGFKVRPQCLPHSQSNITNPALVAALKPNLVTSPLSPRHQLMSPDGSSMGHQLIGPETGPLGPPASPSTLQNPMEQMEGDQSQMVNRQHLRDLLQRQQMKKQEMMFREQQQVQQQQQPQQHGQMPLRHWSPGSMGDQNRPGGNVNLFRPPLPPGMRPRIMSGNQDPTFRHPGQLLEQRGVVALTRAALNDPRIRTALIQQQQQLQQQQLQQQLHQIKHMQQQIQQQHLQCQQNIQQIQMQQPQTMQHQQQLQQIVQKQQQLQQQSQTLQNQKQQLLARATALWNSGQLRLQGQPPRMATGFMGVKTEIGESLGPPPQSPTMQQQQNVQMEGLPQPQQHMMEKFGQTNVLGLQNVPISSASNLNMASSPLYQQRMMQQQQQQQQQHQQQQPHHFPGPPQSPLGPPVSPSHMGINQHLDAMNTGVPHSPNMQMNQQSPQQFPQENPQQMLLPPPSPMPKEENNYQRENVQDSTLFQNQNQEKQMSQEGTTDIKEEPSESGACPLEKLEESPEDEEDILGTTDTIGKKKQTAGDLVKEVEDQGEEALGVDLEDDLDDDDELLGLGNDFNILEYADPELEGGLVGDGEKNNILDEHLDLDEKDDELDAGDVDELKTKLEEKVDLNKPENETKKEIDDPDHPDFKLKECKNEKIDPETFKTEQLDIDSQNEKKYNIPDNNQTNAMEPQAQNQQNFEPNTIQGGPSNPVLESNVPDPGNRDQNRSDPVLNVAQLLQSQEQRPMVMNQHLQQVSHGLASMLSRAPSNMMGERFPRPIQRTVSFPPGMPPPPPYGANQAYQGLVGQPRIQHPHTQQELIAHQQRMQSLQNSQNILTLRHRLQSPNQNLVGIGPQNQEDRLTLPQEQPLLLEDLVEQEKQEQKRQSQESFISPPGDALLSDIDFERLKADVLSCPPEDIGGPSGLMSHSESNVPVLGSPTGAPLQHFPPPQSPLSHPDQVTQQPPPPIWQQHLQHPGMQLSHRPAPPGFHNLQLRAMGPQMMHQGRMQSSPMMHGQHGEMHPRMDMPLQGQFGMPPSRPPFPPSVPPPQLPPHDPVTDQDRQQYALYEQWLVHQQAILTSHQKHFETEVGKLRKNKKSMNARQRQLRRNGQELPDHDQVELSRITQEQTGLQKQLDQVRKQIRQHTTLFQEFRMKQQKFQQQQLMHSGQQNPQGHPSNLGMQLSPLGAAPSPHRPGSVPPQSPMMSPSSMGPSASPRLQHPPSPMMQHSPSHMMQHSPVTMPQSPMMVGPPPSQRSPISASMMMDQNSGPGPRMPHQMIHSQQAMHMQQEDSSFSDRFQQREQFLQHQKRQMMANVNQGDFVGQPFPASLPLQQSQSYPNMSPSASQQSPLSPMQQRTSSQFSPRGNASMSLDDINAIILKSPEGRPPQGSRSQMEMDPTRLGSIHRELTSGQTGAPMMFRDMTFQRPPTQMSQFQQGGAHHMISRSPRPQMMMQEMPQNSPIQSHNSPSTLISQSPRPLSSPLHSSPSQNSMQSSPLIGALQSSPLQSSPVSMPGPIPHYQTRIPSQQASPLHSSPPVSQSTSPGSSGHMSSHPFTHGQKLIETSNSPKTVSPPNPLTRQSPESSIKFENPRSESMDNEGSLESGKNSQHSFEQGAFNSQSPKTGADSTSDSKSEASQNQDRGISGKSDAGNASSSNGDCGRPEGCNTPPATGQCGRPEGCNTPPPTGHCGRPEGCNTPPPTGHCGRPEGCNTPPPTGHCGRPEGCNTPPPTGHCGRPEGCNTPPPTGHCGRPEGCNTPPATGHCGRPEGCNTPPPTGHCGRPEGCNTPPPTGHCGRPEGCNTPPPTGHCGRPEGCNTPPPTAHCGRPEGCNTPPPTAHCSRPEGCNTPPPTGHCGRPEGCNTPPPTGHCGRPEGCNTPPPTGHCGRPEGCNTPPPTGHCGRPEGCNTPPPTGHCGRPEGCNTPPPTGHCGRPEGCNTPPPTGQCGRPEGCNTPPPTVHCGKPEGCNTPPPSAHCGRPEGCNTPPPAGHCGRPEGCNTPPPTRHCGRPEGCNTPPPYEHCGRPEGCNTPPPTGHCGRPEGCNTPPPTGHCGGPEGCNTPPPTGHCGGPAGCNTPPPSEHCGGPEGCNTPPPTGHCGGPAGCNTPPPTGHCGGPEGCNTPPPNEPCGRPEGCNTPPPSGHCGEPEGCNTPPTSGHCGKSEECNTPPAIEDCGRAEGCNTLPQTGNCGRPEGCNTPPPTEDNEISEACNNLSPIEDCGKPVGCNTPPSTEDSGQPKGCNTPPPNEDSGKIEDCNSATPTDNFSRLEECNTLTPTEDSTRLEVCNTLAPPKDSAKPEEKNTAKDSALQERCIDLIPTEDTGRVVGGNALSKTEEATRPEGCNTLSSTVDFSSPELNNTPPTSGKPFETPKQSSTRDSCKPEGSNNPLDGGNFEESNPSPKSGGSAKLEESNIEAVNNDIEKQESMTQPTRGGNENIENSNSTLTSNTLTVPSVTTKANSIPTAIDECKNQSPAESSIIMASVEVSSNDSDKAKCNEISSPDDIVETSEKGDCANTSSPMRKRIKDSSIMQQISPKLNVSEASPISIHDEEATKGTSTGEFPIPSITNSPQAKENVSPTTNSIICDSAQVDTQTTPAQATETSNLSQTDSTCIVQPLETSITNEPFVSPISNEDIVRNNTEIKAVSTLETLERVVSSSSNISFGSSSAPRNIAKISSSKDNSQAAEIIKNPPSICLNPGIARGLSLYAQVTASNYDASSAVTSTSETPCTTVASQKPLLSLQSDVSAYGNVPSSQVISSSAGEIEDSLRKNENLTQDVKKEVINQQSQQQQSTKQQKQEEKEQLINVPLLKIKDEPVDDVSESGVGRFQSVLNRGSESEKASGFDKPVQTLPESSNVDELQSSFSQSVTHTLSFTLRQTGMPAGPVSPQPETSKPMPNIEVSLPVSHIVQQPLTAISQSPSIVVSTSGNHIFATLASQRLTVPQQTSLATLANINPMQITPRPITPIIKHIPSKTHELRGSLSGRPGPPVMVVGMDGGILRPMEPRGLSLLHLSSSSVSKSIKDESKSLNTSPCKLIAQEIKAEALAMASCQLLQATKLLGSNLKSPKSDPGCSNIVRIDVARRMSADTLSHNVVERSESRVETSDSSSQNVLLKQLLQNCPSAETTTPKVEDIPSVLTEKIEEGLSSGIPSSSVDKKDEKSEETGKVKKLSYLDVRRAQLEKEPTPPPPEDTKVKRKRAKKKKDPAKEGGSPTKKRYKKATTLKVDDGHEVFMENLTQQLRALPPIRVLEPRIKPNFNVCSAPGAGDLNAKESCLRGTYGHAHPSAQVDFYASQPFGSNPPTPPSSLPPTPPPIRGYYNQEFPTKSKDQHGRLDIPVSLPTPPPYLDVIRPMRDTDSPDTIISSSSPECLNMEQTAFTFLKLIDDGNHGRKNGRQSISPVIPLVAPIPIRALPSKIFGTDFKLEYDDLEKDKENTLLEEKPDIMMLKNRIIGMGTPPIPLKDSANVSVTLTLSSSASEDIMGVLGKLADILKIPPPSTYEIVGRNISSPNQKTSLYKKSKDPSAHIHNLLNGKPKFCCHCDIVVLSAGIRKKVSELPYLPKEEMDEDEVIFCSTNCYMQFTLTHRALATTEEKEAAAVVSHTSDCSKQPSPVLDKLDDDDETCDSEVKSIKEAKDKLTIIEDKDSSTTLGSLSPLTADISTTPQPLKAISSPIQASEEDKNEELANKPDEVETRDSQETASPIMKDESEEITRKLEKRTSSDSEKPTVKQWKSNKWRYWTIKIFSPKFRQKEEESEEVLRNMCICLVPDKSLQDVRKCVLCHNVGDGDTNGAARLLNMDVDKWIHLNCALWSAEVYETVNGALINVDLACKRSLNLSCCKCHKTGASLKCFRIRCPAIYHFPCAVKDKCGFFKDKTMLCSYHTTKLDNRDNELDSLAVLRRVYINRDEHKQIANMIQKGEQNLLRIGSLLFLNIGQLLPQQLQAFHTPNCIYPVGYKVIRMYWSMNNLSQRCQYICSIHDEEGKPEFHVSVKGKGCDEITLKGKTPKDVWLKILEPIEKMRKEANTIKVFPNFITGDDLLGITEPAILRILESLPGVDTLTNYNFKYGRSPLLELPLAINPTGCARSEPKLRTHFKRPHTLHTRNTSRFSMHNTLAGNEVSSPYTKQFVHSKSSQYRKMKTEWRNNVYLARSQIQGLGLYANRDIEKHTMVIEYIGQLIRNEIAERNELIYETQNRGVYMFRLDENRVIDATLSGGLARYMNHCCNPNCVAEVVQIDRDNKILIIANRRITRGEELTYDYKFEVEDDQHKIPCLCGAIHCRKWMN